MLLKTGTLEKKGWESIRSVEESKMDLRPKEDSLRTICYIYQEVWGDFGNQRGTGEGKSKTNFNGAFGGRGQDVYC